MSSLLLKDMRVVVTGEFGEPRGSIAKKLVSLGAKFTTSISHKTNLLLVGQAPGEAKIKQAREMGGIAIRDAAWLKNVFEKNGLTLRESALKIEDL